MSKTEPFPEFIDFIIKVPLYQQFIEGNYDRNDFYHLEYFKGTVDCFCVGCEKHSVFLVPKKEYTSKSDMNYFFSLNLFCTRNNNHRIVVNFQIHNKVLQKIGQMPSIADLTEPDLRKYRAILGDERYRELTRAIGLASHGVGIGAHVYLRRVFESLIDKYHAVAVAEKADWDEPQYLRSRMDEKIQLLEKYLPPFLVEKKQLYSILSKGVHELSEEDSLKHFPVVRLGIEIILDEELERAKKEKKIADATKKISILHQQLGQKGD